MAADARTDDQSDEAQFPTGSETTRQRTSPVVLTAVSAARAAYAERRRRDALFPDHLLREPVWDILLDLFIARAERRSTPFSNACIAAHVPTTTATRYISAMVGAGLVRRQTQENDKRVVLVEMTDWANSLMLQYFGVSEL